MFNIYRFAWLCVLGLLAGLAGATQAPLNLPTVSPLSGITLVNDINSANDSLNTCNSGGSAPTNQLSGVPSAGNCWLDTSSAPYKWKIYDGAQWVIVAYVDTTNHYWVPVVGGGAVNSIASAAGTTPGTDLCNTTNGQPAYVQVTGTVTITSFGSSCITGQTKIVVFTGALTLTHNATSLILPNNGSNIATAAGDSAVAVYLGGGNWKVPFYMPATGTALSGGSSVTLVGDAAYGILATDNIVATNAVFSTSRTWTLPAANSVSAGKGIDICDRAQAVSPTNTLTVARSGADTIAANGAAVTGIVLSSQSACVRVESDGTSKWVAPVQPPGRVYLATLTASASASINDATACNGSPCLTAAYADYELVFTNIVPATNNVFCRIRVHTGGAYQTTNYATVANIASGGGSPSGAITSVVTHIPCSTTGGQLPNSAPGVTGTIRVNNPSGTAARKQWNGVLGSNANSVANSVVVHGYWDNGNGAVDGFQVDMSAGNIASGTVKIYGILQ